MLTVENIVVDRELVDNHMALCFSFSSYSVEQPHMLEMNQLSGDSDHTQ